MNKVQELLDDPWNLIILQNAKEGKNISQIQKEVDMTYSAIFKKIKDMEKNKLIIIEHNNRGNKIKINPTHSKEIENSLMPFQLSKDYLDKYLPKKDLKEFLGILRKGKRFSSSKDISKEITKKIMPYIPHLERVGLIKQRMEIMKLGKRCLENLDKNPAD